MNLAQPEVQTRTVAVCTLILLCATFAQQLFCQQAWLNTLLDLDSTCLPTPLSPSSSQWSNTWLASSRPCSRLSFRMTATRSRRCVLVARE